MRTPRGHNVSAAARASKCPLTRMFQFSRRLALLFGLLLPVVETLRRWQQLGDLREWPAWLADLLLAALLLLGVRMTAQLRYHNAKYLVAAWGVTCGMAYGSFFSSALHLDVPDPGPAPAVWVAAIKGLGFALAIAALIGALKVPAVAPRVMAPAVMAPVAMIEADALGQHPGRLDEMLDATDDA